MLPHPLYLFLIPTLLLKALPKQKATLTQMKGDALWDAALLAVSLSGKFGVYKNIVQMIAVESAPKCQQCK